MNFTLLAKIYMCLIVNLQVTFKYKKWSENEEDDIVGYDGSGAVSKKIITILQHLTFAGKHITISLCYWDLEKKKSK